MMRRDTIKRIIEDRGMQGYLRFQHGLLEGRNPDTGKACPKARPQDFSLRAMWEAMVGPVEETTTILQNRYGYVELPQLDEAVASSAFPSATGQLIARMVIDGYEDDAGWIGDRLVRPMPSNLRNERIPGFTTLQGPKPVGELESYQESTFEEKYVGTRETKRGRLLSISEEAVVFDQTGMILEKARMLGYMSRQERERRIVRAVIDADSGQPVYQPQGVATQLYSAGNSNLLSTNTPLQDWTDIQEVLTFHATNITDDREPDDEHGQQPIVWNPRQLLVAKENQGNAARIVNATEVRGDTTNERTMSMNPLTSIASGLEVLSSPFIDLATDGDQWDDASDWLLGDFPRQFRYKEIWPLQTLRAPAQNKEQFERDVVARFKVREYGDVIAVDHRLVIKVNAA